MSQIAARRSFTEERIGQLQSQLVDAEALLSGRACVYATGSYGRREASTHSDLDLFIVGKTSTQKDNKKESMLSRLSEICVKADLIKVTRSIGIREFDGDGKYLTHHPVNCLVDMLGKPGDDFHNTFTARMLLLLESHPLIGKDVYDHVIKEILAAYWGDYEDHSEEFLPAFLANDILRFWRTFCVNYEAMTDKSSDEKKIKRRVKNYKLKYSRLITCFSGLLYLLCTFSLKRTVRAEDVLHMISQTPTDRLSHLIKSASTTKKARDYLEGILAKYDHFLEITNVRDADLFEQFSDKTITACRNKEAREFGTLMFDAIDSIGQRNKFHRLLVV